MKTDNEQKLMEFMQECTIVDTHCHHHLDSDLNDSLADMSVFKLMKNSYIGWIINDWDADSPEGRKHFFDKYLVNSYSYWLIRGIEELHPSGVPFSAETWDLYDKKIKDAYSDPEHHIRVLKENCRYTNVILDRYDDPGWDNGHPDLFNPAFRTDCFFHAYDKEHHMENNCFIGYPWDVLPECETLEDYITALHDYVARCYRGEVPGRHVSALKIGIAYARNLRFENRDIEKARKAYMVPSPTEEAIRDFQDYVMYAFMDIARELHMPVQVHTGLATLDRTNAIQLCNLIAEYPDVTFDLFHGSFPWTDDILALAHNYNNCYVDLCWLPIISTTRAITFIKEALEVTDANRLLWGCDTWTSEESYGAVLAGRYALAKALGEMVDHNQISLSTAKDICKKTLGDNAREIFGF